MDSNCCISCGKSFLSTNLKTVDKRSVSSKLGKIDRTVKEVLEEDLGVKFTPEQKKKRFLCQKCVWTVTSYAKSHDASVQALKKLKETTRGPTYLAKKLRSPVPTPRKIKKQRILSPAKSSTENAQQTATGTSKGHDPVRKKPTKTESEVNRALTYLRLRQYQRGLTLLLKTRSGAAKAFCQLVREKTQGEINIFLQQQNSKFGAHQTLENWKEFSWDSALEEMREKCPILTSCLVGALTSKNTLGTGSLRGKPNISAAPTIGTIMAILAYQVKPKKMANLQELNALEMWLASCKRQLFARFNHLGLCVGIKATLSAVDRIRHNFDSKVFEWRNTITDHLLLPSDMSTADTIPYAEGSSTPSSMSVDTPALSPVRLPRSPTRLPRSPLRLPRSPLRLPRSPMRRQSLASSESEEFYTVSHSSSLSSKNVDQGKPSFSICFDNVNQKTTVRHQTRDKKNKMYNMVQAYAAQDRINTLHMSDEMPTPDEILNIPLSKLLPNEMDEVDMRSYLTTLVERILCSQIPYFHEVKAEVNWHISHQYSQKSTQKSEMVLLGVLDKDESRVGDTIDIVNHYHQYVPLKPDGSPLTLPLHADGLSCERVNDAQNARTNGTTKWMQLQGLFPNIQEWHKRCLLLQDAFDELYSGKSSRETGTLFHLKNYFEHRNVSGNVKDSFNYDEDFLEFCTEGYITLLALNILEMKSLHDAPNTEDKLQCLHMTSSQIIDKVFQSALPTVQNILKTTTEDPDDTYPYCICKTEQPGTVMVFCENRNCPRGIWFHVDCIEIEEEDIPDGAWFCSRECEIEKAGKKSKKRTAASNLKDMKMDYALLLMWRGLSQMLRRDCIRENNGNMIIVNWKLDLLQFFSKHHPKYFLLCTRLLLAVNGSVSPRLQTSLVWNRTVNVNGGRGKNIEMDLQMEYFNKEYKESVKDAAGHLTEDTIARHSQMIGVGKDINKVYDISVSGMSGRTIHKGGKPDRSKDIEEFVNLLLPEDIFTSHPGRHYKSFSNLEVNVYVNAYPKNIRDRLTRIRKEESKKLARRERMLE